MSFCRDTAIGSCFILRSCQTNAFIKWMSEMVKWMSDDVKCCVYVPGLGQENYLDVLYKDKMSRPFNVDITA